MEEIMERVQLKAKVKRKEYVFWHGDATLPNSKCGEIEKMK